MYLALLIRFTYAGISRSRKWFQRHSKAPDHHDVSHDGRHFLIVGIVPELMSVEPRWGTSLFLFLMLATVGTFSTYFNIKKQRQLFESFILKIDHEKIVRERLNTPVLIIYHKDITKIIKQANGGFLIQGKSKLDSIRIPVQMEDYQQLEIALNQLKRGCHVLICSILFRSIYF